jgi:hypothetical protein
MAEARLKPTVVVMPKVEGNWAQEKSEASISEDNSSSTRSDPIEAEKGLVVLFCN